MSVCVSVSVCNCVSALPCLCVCVCEHISLSACVSAHLLRPLLPWLEPPTCLVVPLPPVEMTGFPTAPSYLLPARSLWRRVCVGLGGHLAASTLKSCPRGPFAQEQGNGVQIGPSPPPPELNPAPPPRSPSASPTTSWRRREPQEGASLTSLLWSRRCWNGLRGEVAPSGWTPEPEEKLARLAGQDW